MLPDTSTTARATRGTAIPRVGLLLVLVLASPAVASALSLNILAGYGWVGPAQYDQGRSRPMMTVNLTDFLRVSDKLSFLGVGVGIRASEGADRILEKDTFDEFGLAVPFVTYRWRRLAGQLGVEIQRANLKKNFYYVAVGVGLGGRRAPKPPAGARAVPASD